MTIPWQHSIGQLTPLRHLYTSVAQVVRLNAVFQDDGTMSNTWDTVPDILDPFLDTPGQFGCRLDVGALRPGKDQPPPLVAGRAPDRVGVLLFDLLADDSGLPLVRAGDRITMVSGPVFGTWEIRVQPDVAQDFTGAHHAEVQVIEVAQQLSPGSPQVFPGSPA